VGMYKRVVYTSPTMVVEFEMDRRGIRQVAHGPELRAAVYEIAKKGQAYAESISPEQTGNYKRSWQVNMSRVMVAGMRRISAKLVNTDPAAVPIEVGASGPRGETPAHRVLQRTLSYLGGRPEVRGVFRTPIARGASLERIPTLRQFRAAQQRARERDRRHRQRHRPSRHRPDD
jgi:hypothetical protein